MSQKAIRIITALGVIASGVLAVGDKIKSMPFLPGWVTSSWPIITIGALVFKEVAQILIAPTPPEK